MRLFVLADNCFAERLKGDIDTGYDQLQSDQIAYEMHNMRVADDRQLLKQKIDSLQFQQIMAQHYLTFSLCGTKSRLVLV